MLSLAKKSSDAKRRLETTNFQPTIQPTICDVLYDSQVFWQSPLS